MYLNGDVYSRMCIKINRKNCILNNLCFFINLYLILAILSLLLVRFIVPLSVFCLFITSHVFTTPLCHRSRLPPGILRKPSLYYTRQHINATDTFSTTLLNEFNLVITQESRVVYTMLGPTLKLLNGRLVVIRILIVALGAHWPGLTTRSPVNCRNSFSSSICTDA